MIDVLQSQNRVSTPAIAIRSQPVFPSLKIVPIEKLITHEHFDPVRSTALQERLLSDGVLRNPPLVAPLHDPDGNYMVLDGANRTNALKQLQVPHVLVQVASPEVPGFELSAWNQVVLGVEPEDLVSVLGGMIGIKLKATAGPGLDEVGDFSILMQLHLAKLGIYNVYSPNSDLQSRVQTLQSILDRLGQFARLDRTHLTDLDVLMEMHADLAGLMLFPCFNFEEIARLALDRQMIPAGMTHFSFSPRALRLNYPISELGSERSLAEKNEMLRTWIQERVNMKGVRFYSETTVMFDE